MGNLISTPSGVLLFIIVTENLQVLFVVWSANAKDDEKYNGKILERTKESRTREPCHEDWIYKVGRRGRDDKAWNWKAKT